jgi:hypothetical protein
MRGALRDKYSGESYACFEEIKPTVGMDGRKLDFLVMNLWRSRGLQLEGIEIKTDRRDWLRELRAPAKQEGIFVFCDRFWLATSNEKVAKAEEIPPTWGWMILSPKGALQTRKKPPKLKGKAFTRAFVAEVLRHETKARSGQIRKALGEQAQKLEDEGKLNNNPEYAAIQHAHNELNARVKNFEEASGLEVTRWARPSIGKAVRLLQRIQEDALNPVERMEHVLRQLDLERVQLERAIADCKEAVPELVDKEEE